MSMMEECGLRTIIQVNISDMFQNIDISSMVSIITMVEESKTDYYNLLSTLPEYDIVVVLRTNSI